MAASNPACVAIEIEQRIIRHREAYERTKMLAHQAQRAAFQAARYREELEARHQQALEEARRNEQSVRQAFESVEQAHRWMFDELQQLEALLQSVRAGINEEIVSLFVFTCLWNVMNL